MASIGKVKQFWADTFDELKKIAHPTRQEAIQATIVTILFMVFFAVILALLDWILKGIVWEVL